MEKQELKREQITWQDADQACWYLFQVMTRVNLIKQNPFEKFPYDEYCRFVGFLVRTI